MLQSTRFIKLFSLLCKKILRIIRSSVRNVRFLCPLSAFSTYHNRTRQRARIIVVFGSCPVLPVVNEAMWTTTTRSALPPSVLAPLLLLLHASQIIARMCEKTNAQENWIWWHTMHLLGCGGETTGRSSDGRRHVFSACVLCVPEHIWRVMGCTKEAICGKYDCVLVASERQWQWRMVRSFVRSFRSDMSSSCARGHYALRMKEWDTQTPSQTDRQPDSVRMDLCVDMSVK